MIEENDISEDSKNIINKINQYSYLDSWDEFSFSFLDLLNASSPYDFINDSSTMNDEECANQLQKTKHKKPNVKPYIAINDLNNTDDEPYLNKPKNAIEIGINVEF